MAIKNGAVYYDTGELFFEGRYDDSEYSGDKPWRPLFLIEGTEYRKDGTKRREGFFQMAGLLVGREYYESGALKFEGVYNDKRFDRHYKVDDDTLKKTGLCFQLPLKLDRNYYGPSYPVYGRFYAEDGSLLYEGKFSVGHHGNVGYPKIVFPEGFGSLN